MKQKRISLKGIHDISDLLSKDSNKHLIDDFIKEHLSTCDTMLIIYQDGEGNIRMVGTVPDPIEILGMLSAASYLVHSAQQEKE